ncbi:hypothetical protein P8452_30258 [Trifolium repens]|nr:hypothetical protein P8452_30258 [Trifolium repens]
MERKINQKGIFCGSHHSPGIFGSLFSCKSPLVFGRESVSYQAKGKTVKETLGTSTGTQADLWKSNGNESQIVRAEDLCSIFKVPTIEPSNNIWSSIFNVESTQNAGFTSRGALITHEIILANTRHMIYKAHSRMF